MIYDTIINKYNNKRRRRLHALWGACQRLSFLFVFFMLNFPNK